MISGPASFFIVALRGFGYNFYAKLTVSGRPLTDRASSRKIRMTIFIEPLNGKVLPVTLLSFFLFFLYLASPCLAKTKIEGRVFTEGGPLQGATVYAYTSYDAVISGRASGISSKTDDLGQYKMQLPEGDYYMTARGTRDGRRYFSYHGANPVTAGRQNLWIVFMANEVKKPSYSAGNAEVMGVVTYKGKPVKDAHIAFYTLENRRFKGIGYMTEPVQDDGTFHFSLPPNKYVVIARKTRGNEIRPLENGELYCYYPSNPVEIRAGQTVSIEVPCYPKAERSSFSTSPIIKTNDYLTVEQSGNGNEFGIKGTVTDSTGKPVKGIYVLAFKVDPANTPALAKTFKGTHETETVGKTDQSGNYFIPLDDDGNYAVVARSVLGAGTPKVNEVYGVYRDTFRKGLPFKKGQLIGNVNIIVVTPLSRTSPED